MKNYNIDYNIYKDFNNNDKINFLKDLKNDIIKNNNFIFKDYGILNKLNPVVSFTSAYTGSLPNSLAGTTGVTVASPTVAGTSKAPILDLDAVFEDSKSKIEGFLSDMFNVAPDRSFRGWILPNGKLMSQFNISEMGGRQDHGNLIKLFINSLKEYDASLYEKLINTYNEYLQNNYGSRGYYDIHESFAVEVLGWMQVSYQAQRKIIAQGTNWQNKFLRPFFTDYGFALEIRPNKGYINLDIAYDNIMEIIKLGLEADKKGPEVTVIR